jgi:hypothetical protein
VCLAHPWNSLLFASVVDSYLHESSRDYRGRVWLFCENLKLLAALHYRCDCTFVFPRGTHLLCLWLLTEKKLKAYCNARECWLTKRIMKGKYKYMIAFCPKCTTDKHWTLHNQNAFILWHLKMAINMLILGESILRAQKRKEENTNGLHMRKPKEPPPLQEHVVNYRVLR